MTGKRGKWSCKYSSDSDRHLTAVIVLPFSSEMILSSWEKRIS